MILAQQRQFVRGLIGLTLLATASAVGTAHAAGPNTSAEPLLLSQLSPDAGRRGAGIGFRQTELGNPLGNPLGNATVAPIDFRFGNNTTASLGFRPTINAITLNAAHQFTDSWGVSGQFLGSRGLLAQPWDGPVRSATARGDGFALGLVKTETWLRGDRLSLTVSQPPGFTTGPLGFDAPLNSASSGLLAPRNGAREVRTELRYDTQIFKSSGLGLSLINRVRPNDANLAPDERIMMMRFTTQF